MSSGAWAGQGAADYARQLGAIARRRLSSAGTIAFRNRSRRAFEPAALAKTVQNEVVPYELNYFRDASRLHGALARLDAAWLDVSEADAANSADVLRAREGAAMLATARWMYRSALARQESRGMHRRDDFPGQDDRQRHYRDDGRSRRGLDLGSAARRSRLRGGRGMIEVIDAERCTSCDICVNVCPTNVFDKTDGIPVIARQSDCQTCFLCELYCPEDALYVSPFADETQTRRRHRAQANGRDGQLPSGGRLDRRYTGSARRRRQLSALWSLSGGAPHAVGRHQ